MINCAHPTHFDHVLDAGGEWTKRLRGFGNYWKSLFAFAAYSPHS